ncbi:MAG: hypothetical protein EZS28_004970, partial [Streblomastix strix]
MESASIYKKMFKFEPSKIHFKDIQRGQKYQQTVTIFNITNHPQKVWVGRPENIEFQIDKSLSFSISPGLSYKTTITFMCSIERSFEDSLTFHSEETVSAISCNPNEQTLILLATPPIADIWFDNEIDFGPVSAGSVTAKYIRIWNIGTRHGDFTVNYPANSPLQAMPTNGVIYPLDEEGKQLLDFMESSDSDNNTLQSSGKLQPPNWKTAGTNKKGILSNTLQSNQHQLLPGAGHGKQSAIRMRIELTAPRLVGELNTSIDISCDTTSPNHVINIHANIVQQHVEFIIPTAPDIPLTMINFGSLFYGEKRQVDAQLKNVGSQQVTFALSQQGKDIMPVIFIPG